MLISGTWHLCDDGIIRPVIHAEIQAADDAWVKAPLLVDTGADRTVFSVDILRALRLEPVSTEARLGGIGGVASAIIVETRIRLTHESHQKIMLRGQYAAVTDMQTLDMSVLGRDVTNLFSLIIDWPKGLVSLLGQRHQYTISQLS
jgi:predicted aspartyl protease